MGCHQPPRWQFLLPRCWPESPGGGWGAYQEAEVSDSCSWSPCSTALQLGTWMCVNRLAPPQSSSLAELCPGGQEKAAGRFGSCPGCRPSNERQVLGKGMSAGSPGQAAAVPSFAQCSMSAGTEPSPRPPHVFSWEQGQPQALQPAPLLPSDLLSLHPACSLPSCIHGRAWSAPRMTPLKPVGKKQTSTKPQLEIPVSPVTMSNSIWVGAWLCSSSQCVGSAPMCWWQMTFLLFFFHFFSLLTFWFVFWATLNGALGLLPALFGGS